MDIFDDVLNLEEKWISDGKNEGYDAGSSMGDLDSKNLGYQKGIELGMEIGEILSNIVYSLYIISENKVEMKKEKKEKLLVTLNDMKEKIERLDYEDASSEELFKEIDTLRSKNKLITSQLGLNKEKKQINEENSW
eukprot:TRINITY_DN12772_c0_g1_i1.p1 TRINITY_DN12772_c0_g1~~TRINITY_DN12772_c0_g1_i1.p1  ORF type:complete len:136 (+),score=53.33 TRINITY_DN12772_c0_g1_i1:31-438(+)